VSNASSPGATNPNPSPALARLHQAWEQRHDIKRADDDPGDAAVTAAALATVPVGTAVTVPTRRRDVLTVTWRRSETSGSRTRAPKVRVGRHEARPSRPATRRRGASSATSGSDPGDSDGGESEPSPGGRLCRAPWCDHPAYGKALYCGTERCSRARAAERKRKQRHGDQTSLERQRFDDARAAHYTEFASGWPREGHALSFLWRFGLLGGTDPGELEAIQKHRACRCNGHHIDGGAVGCLKCGLVRLEAVAA
jgi:hypothetical protein